jgi:hypothetical protein
MRVARMSYRCRPGWLAGRVSQRDPGTALRAALGLLLLIGVSGSARHARAQADVLLEKAFYYEQTRGDLDQAIALYKQVVDEQRRSGPKAARAQYHLGVCLWKVGRLAESQQMFRELAHNYSEEKDLVSAASRFLSDSRALLAPCWEDGETLEYALEFQTGVEAGYLIVCAHKMIFEGRPVWRLLSQQNAPNYGGPSKRYVFVDRDGFRPLFNSYIHPIVGEFETRYQEGRVTIVSNISAASSIKELLWFGPVYDFEQHWHLVRQLPLAVGYRASMPVVCCAEGEIADLELRVTGIEEVVTPAGRFECFRVETRVGRGGMQAVLWYTTDEHRYLVGFDEWVVQGRLRALGRRSRDETAQYQSSRFGFSLSAPAGWYFYNRTETGSKGQEVVFLLEPNAAFAVQVRAQDVDSHGASHPSDAEAVARRLLQDDALRLKGLTERSGSWRVERNDPRTEARVIADYSDGDQKRLEYVVCITDKRLAIHLVADGPLELEREIQAALDALVRSLRIP